MTARPGTRSSSGEPGSEALVNEAWMLRLEQLGYERARGASPWDEITTPYERPAAGPPPRSSYRRTQGSEATEAS
jgi:hypothetical protein